MEDLLVGYDPEPKEKWFITSDEQAETYIEYKEEELVEIRRYKMALENKIALLKGKLDSVNKEEKDIISNRDFYLREYFATKDEKELKKTKTLSKYRLPSVELVMKYPEPEYKRDETKLTEWLLTTKLEDYVTTKVSVTPNWSELKKETKTIGTTLVFIPTGEIIEGVTVVEREPEFKVEIK